MYVRVSTTKGATDIDAGIRFLEEKVVPELQQQRGFRGVTASADRAGEIVGVVSLWDTEEDMAASESVATKVRQEGRGVLGGDVTVETFEQVVADIGDPPPAVGCCLRVIRVKMDPARIDDNIEFFRSEIVPRMKATPGFRGVRNLIDRASGHGVVGTLWNDEESMKSADAAAEQRRQEAASRGVEFGEMSTRVLLFSHLT
jgi:heme-degrading monooxygenase HmoA